MSGRSPRRGKAWLRPPAGAWGAIKGPIFGSRGSERHCQVLRAQRVWAGPQGGTLGWVYLKIAATPQVDGISRFHIPDRGSRSHLMNVASLSQDLYEFVVELRRLAYTMPGGHEDSLVHLSERMVRCAREQAAEQHR